MVGPHTQMRPPPDCLPGRPTHLQAWQRVVVAPQQHRPAGTVPGHGLDAHLAYLT